MVIFLCYNEHAVTLTVESPPGKGLRMLTFINESTDPFYNQAFEALQVAGLCNHAGRSTGAVQMAGCVNSIGSDFAGVQVSGLYNSVSGTMSGLSVALLTKAETVDGLQVGIFNKTKVLNGVQVGVVNLAGESDGGIQLGVVNVMKDAAYPVMPVFNVGF